MTIYDGLYGPGTPMIGKYCGDSIPPSHISSSNEVSIYFQSDVSVTSAGFKMEYNPSGEEKDINSKINLKYHVDTDFGKLLVYR